MKVFLSAILIILWPIFSIAAGTFTLKGKVHSFDTKTITINDGIHAYKINKSKINMAQKENLQALKVGSSIELAVSFTAIESATVLSEK